MSSGYEFTPAQNTIFQRLVGNSEAAAPPMGIPGCGHPHGPGAAAPPTNHSAPK